MAPISGTPQPERKHRATYATDKKKGGYLIRVTGPWAEQFAGRTVPVTTKAGTEHEETLSRLLWTGKDTETGDNVALYTFVAKPREAEKEVQF
jgi:hypothetical protein